MNSKLNKDEDIENKIASNFAVIANESKTILTAIDELKKKIEKAEKVKGMFAAISGRYDLLNRVLSGGTAEISGIERRPDRWMSVSR